MSDILTLDQIEDRALAVLITLYRQQTVTWIRELQQVNSLDQFVNLSPLGPWFPQIMEKTLMLAYMKGFEDEAEEVTEFKEPLPAEWEVQGFDAALRALKQKRVISPAQFKAAEAQIKAMSFSVQKIERLDALMKIRESLQAAINTGASLKDWKGNLADIFEAHGVTPLKPWHIENVFRTNLQSTYNVGHREAVMGDRNVELLQFIGVPDERQSSICRDLNGLIYPKDDPIWDTITPPNHYQCRSRTRPISKQRARRNGITKSDPITADQLEGVDEDFRQAPRDIKGLRRKLDKLAAVREREAETLK